MARHNKKGRSTTVGRYVALPHWMMQTPAWRSLEPVARCAYIELSARYAGPGSNNGRISMAVRELGEALHASKATASRALARLQERGFIVLMSQGAFNIKHRHASEWRLTEFPCDVTGKSATKDFSRWQIQNTVSPGAPTGHDMKPNG